MTLNEAYDLYRSVRDSGEPTIECIEKLYPLVKAKVSDVVGQLTHTRDEDLIVTITTDVLMGIDKFVPQHRFSTWVEAAARHACLNRFNQDESGRRPHRREPGVLEPPAFQPHAFDKSLQPRAPEEPGYDFDDRRIELREMIQQLNPDEQELLRFHFEGYRSAELSEILNTPAGTIRRKIHEIVNKLRVSRS